MRKNPSPAYIAVFGASIGVLLAMLIAWVAGYDALDLLPLFLGVGLLTALAFYALLIFFIQRKIELVYQNIYRFKAQDSKLVDMLSKPGSDPVEEMSSDVRRWMQQNKQEIVELKEQAKFRREFVSNVSHELKTPIFAVQGYIHTLLDGALEDKEVNRVFLRKAAKAVDQLADLVEDLTEINRLQSGAIRLNIQKFDFAELCTEAFELLEKQAAELGVELELKREGIRNLMVSADRRQILQVLSNLVGNAIRYAKTGKRVEVICNELGSKLFIDVRDYGEGIEEEHLPRLFDRFYRVDRHRNKEEGGTGLGLSIVKHILELHEETVSVRSVIGRGTTFTFTLTRG